MPNMSPNKVKMPEQDPNVRNKNFEEVSLGYTKEQAMEEATRCLNCKKPFCMDVLSYSWRKPGFRPTSSTHLCSPVKGQTANIQ